MSCQVEKKAKVVLSDNFGVVYFDQFNDRIKIYGYIVKLSPFSLHAIHIHEYGDLTNGCSSTGEHFNPTRTVHGCRSQKMYGMAHVGDLGNVKADANGVADFCIYDKFLRLDGEFSCVGRAFVVHKNPDDCGLAGTEESLKNGTSGERISCGIIGLCE